MADVSNTLVAWSSTTASNNPSGSTAVGTNLDDNLRELQGVVVRGLSHKGSDIASDTTTDLGAVEGLMHDITGSTTITGFGTVRAGILKVVKFEGILTLTHNATSLVLPWGGNITTAVGDVGIFISEGSGNWRCLSYTPTRGDLRAEQATTSGTEVDFSSIPTWAKRITVMLDGVSLSGTDELLIQLGDGGGVETSSYTSSVVRISSAGNAVPAASTAGFILDAEGVAVAAISGSVILTLMDAANNTWIAHGCLYRSGDSTAYASGVKSLSATLTTVRIAATGANTLDAGAVSILVE